MAKENHGNEKSEKYMVIFYDPPPEMNASKKLEFLS